MKAGLVPYLIGATLTAAFAVGLTLGWLIWRAPDMSAADVAFASHLAALDSVHAREVTRQAREDSLDRQRAVNESGAVSAAHSARDSAAGAAAVSDSTAGVLVAQADSTFRRTFALHLHADTLFRRWTDSVVHADSVALADADARIAARDTTIGRLNRDLFDDHLALEQAADHIAAAERRAARKWTVAAGCGEVANRHGAGLGCAIIFGRRLL